MEGLADFTARLVECRRCPRLVSWREAVAAAPPRAHAGEAYWARPVPGFGDPAARLLILGLAPAAHGGNRTGRVFTGDRSGEWLFRALHRAGFANQPEAHSRDDGLELSDAYIVAAVRCAPPANRPTSEELATCFAWLREEYRLLPVLRVVLCLGGIAYQTALRLLVAEGIAVPRPRPRFGHCLVVETPGPTLVCSYHPSQQNTFTGRLTEEMLDGALAAAARALR